MFPTRAIGASRPTDGPARRGEAGTDAAAAAGGFPAALDAAANPAPGRPPAALAGKPPVPERFPGWPAGGKFAAGLVGRLAATAGSTGAPASGAAAAAASMTAVPAPDDAAPELGAPAPQPGDPPDLPGPTDAADPAAAALSKIGSATAGLQPPRHDPAARPSAWPLSGPSDAAPGGPPRRADGPAAHRPETAARPHHPALAASATATMLSDADPAGRLLSLPVLPAAAPVPGGLSATAAARPSGAAAQPISAATGEPNGAADVGPAGTRAAGGVAATAAIYGVATLRRANGAAVGTASPLPRPADQSGRSTTADVGTRVAPGQSAAMRGGIDPEPANGTDRPGPASAAATDALSAPLRSFALIAEVDLAGAAVWAPRPAAVPHSAAAADAGTSPDRAPPAGAAGGVAPQPPGASAPPPRSDPQASGAARFPGAAGDQNSAAAVGAAPSGADPSAARPAANAVHTTDAGIPAPAPGAPPPGGPTPMAAATAAQPAAPVAEIAPAGGRALPRVAEAADLIAGSAVGPAGAAPAAADSGSVASPPASGAAPTGLVDRLSAQMIQTLGSGDRDIVLRLHPPELGDVSVRVLVSGREVSAWFDAPQTPVQQAISLGLGQLHSDLANAGYNLNGAWVGGDAWTPRGRGGGAPAPSRQTREPGGGGRIEAAADAAAAGGSGVSIYV